MPAKKIAHKGPQKAKKHVGKSVVSLSGRTITCASAKHAYKNNAAAKAAYSRCKTVKSVEGFKARYGKTTAAKKPAKKRPTKQRRNPVLPSTIIPAYGRDYKSKAAAVKAFEDGKDWIISDFSSPWDGKPISIRDFPAGSTVTLRYGNMRKVTRYTVKGKNPSRRCGTERNAPLTPAEKRALAAIIKKHRI